MQVESQALNRAKALLNRLANPTPPKARATSIEPTQCNPQYFSCIGPSKEIQNVFESGKDDENSSNATLIDIKNLPKNYLTETKQPPKDDCDEKKSYARLAMDKTQFRRKARNLENSRKDWKLKKQQLDMSEENGRGGEASLNRSRQRSTENKVKEFITTFNAEKMKVLTSCEEQTVRRRSHQKSESSQNKENQMSKGDMSISRISANKQSNTSFISYQTENQNNRTVKSRKESGSINLSMEMQSRRRNSSFHQDMGPFGKMPALIFKENLKDIVANQSTYSQIYQEQTMNNKRNQYGSVASLDETQRQRAKSISVQSQSKKPVPCPNPSLFEVGSESFVDEKSSNNVSIIFGSENRTTGATSRTLVKETHIHERPTSRNSVNISVDFLAKLLQSKRNSYAQLNNSSIELLLEGQKTDPVTSVSLIDQLIKYHHHNESSDPIEHHQRTEEIQAVLPANNLDSDVEGKLSSCIGIAKPYQDLRRPRHQEAPKISPIPQKIDKNSLLKNKVKPSEQPKISVPVPKIHQNNYNSIQVGSRINDSPIFSREGYKSVPYKTRQEIENQATFLKVDYLEQQLKIKYGYKNSDFMRTPPRSLMSPGDSNNNSQILSKNEQNREVLKAKEEFRFETNTEMITEANNNHEIFQTQQSTIYYEQKGSELYTNISLCNEKEERVPCLPSRDSAIEDELEKLREEVERERAPKLPSRDSTIENELEILREIVLAQNYSTAADDVGNVEFNGPSPFSERNIFAYEKMIKVNEIPQQQQRQEMENQIESFEEDSLEIQPKKIFYKKSINRWSKTIFLEQQSNRDRSLNKSFHQIGRDQDLSISRRSGRGRKKPFEFHEVKISYRSDYKEQILSEILNQEALISDFSSFSYDE